MLVIAFASGAQSGPTSASATEQPRPEDAVVWLSLSGSSHAPRRFRSSDHCPFASGAGAPRIGMSLVPLGEWRNLAAPAWRMSRVLVLLVNAEVAGSLGWRVTVSRLRGPCRPLPATSAARAPAPVVGEVVLAVSARPGSARSRSPEVRLLARVRVLPPVALLAEMLWGRAAARVPLIALRRDR